MGRELSQRAVCVTDSCEGQSLRSPSSQGIIEMLEEADGFCREGGMGHTCKAAYVHGG